MFLEVIRPANISVREKDDSFAAEYLETYRKFTMNDDKLWRKVLISLREGGALFVCINYISIDISDI